MLNEGYKDTLATCETIITVVSKLSEGIATGDTSAQPSEALKHKVASALMKKLAIHMPKPE